MNVFLRSLLALAAVLTLLTSIDYSSPLAERSLASVQDAWQRVTLPYQVARLSAQPPDEVLSMPVDGVRVAQVADTWGAPRSGGRRHEGQDIFAERGTPVRSATSGYVARVTSGTLGGNSVFVLGAGGQRYYYTHLDAFAEGLEVGDAVTTDTVIGFVGNSGNAAPTPTHLHFGVYANRGAVNPLPLLVDRDGSSLGETP